MELRGCLKTNEENKCCDEYWKSGEKKSIYQEEKEKESNSASMISKIISELIQKWLKTTQKNSENFEERPKDLMKKL